MELIYNNWPELARSDVSVIAPEQRAARRRVQAISQAIDFHYEASRPTRAVDPRVYDRRGHVGEGGEQPRGTLLDARA